MLIIIWHPFPINIGQWLLLERKKNRTQTNLLKETKFTHTHKQIIFRTRRGLEQRPPIAQMQRHGHGKLGSVEPGCARGRWSRLCRGRSHSRREWCLWRLGRWLGCRKWRCSKCPRCSRERGESRSGTAHCRTPLSAPLAPPDSRSRLACTTLRSSRISHK